MANEQTRAPNEFLEFMKQQQESNRPNLLQTIGTSLVGASAPFLGQEYTNPYTAKASSGSTNDALSMLMMMEFLGKGDKGGKSVAPSAGIVPTDTSQGIGPLPTAQGGFNQLQQPQGSFEFGSKGRALIDISESEKKQIGIEANLQQRERALPLKAAEGAIAGQQKITDTWRKEAADRQIKFDVVNPKLDYFMEFGGRAYKELRDSAAERGIDLNFEEGGFEAIKAMATKNVAMKLKMAPLMESLKNLRPELGTELMRQLGAFRSGQMAKTFENTIAQFSGDIREDIANMSSTMTKNVANIELLDDKGKRVSSKETVKRMKTFEANAIRVYNKMYRKMGITTKPYTAGLSLDDLVERSRFSEQEESIISDALDSNEGAKRKPVIKRLIEEGYL